MPLLLSSAAILLLSLPAGAASAEQVPGAATAIAADPVGSVFVIGTSPCDGNGCTVYQRQSGSWNPLPGTAVRVAAGPEGPWVLNQSGEIYQFSNGSFRQINTMGTDVSVGADGSVFIIGTDGCTGSGCQVYQLKNGQNLSYPGTAVRVAVGPTGQPWIINRAGEIFRWNGSQFQQLSGLGTEIAIAGDGTVYLIGTSPCNDSGCTVYRREGENWTPLSATATRIAAGSDVWIINARQEIFRLTTSVQTEADGATVLRVSNSGKCLDLPGGNAPSGTQIVQTDCSSSSTSQVWVQRFVSGPWAMLLNGQSGLCMEVQDRLTPGSLIVQRPCNVNLKQQWFHIRPEKEGNLNTIVSQTSELCVGMAESGATQQSCSTEQSQRFSRVASSAEPAYQTRDALSILNQDVFGIEDPDPEVCWMKTTTRGVGSLATSCPNPSYPEHDGALLCYEKCRAGYSNTTLFTCGQTCPAGWGNEPATCRKPSTYNVSGYTLYLYELWKSLDTLHREAKARCESGTGTACEWRAALYYPVCKAGYAPEALAAWVCAPRCPAGMSDSGFGSCWKQSYIKGSIPTDCPAGKMRDPHDRLGLAIQHVLPARLRLDQFAGKVAKARMELSAAPPARSQRQPARSPYSIR